MPAVATLSPGARAAAEALPGMLRFARPPRRRALVSLTPLIDVVFILLVFFMLASSFVDWRVIGLEVGTPGVASGPVEGALLIEQRGDGLRFGGEPLPMEAVVARTAARLAAAPGTPVLVRPAAGVSLQDTVSLLDRLTAVGARQVSVIREPGR
jgi:biopolymer transport protein ExbD